MIDDDLRILDKRLVAAARSIKVLSCLSWPLEVQDGFLHHWEAGKKVMPTPDYGKPDYSEEIEELTIIERDLAGDHPLLNHMAKTARSYRLAAQLVEAAGTDRVTELSRELYGVPGDSFSGGSQTNTDAANHFLEISATFRDQVSDDANYCLSAATMKREMEARLTEVFPPNTITVVIDPEMASKAAAGATRVRLRGDTCFSEYDLEQLLQHEAFVHSLTALNGREQPLSYLGFGAPRTTGAQEGLATFSELITGAIDLHRTNRIALRVLAVELALEGADFIQVFEFFLANQQNQMESFNSAMRVFRGVPLTGGQAFTKDVVYLHGLMEIHTFFRWALMHDRLNLTRYFLSGRMTINDVIALAPMFEDGTLRGPRYLPPWMTRARGLAGYLAFSVFANRIRIGELDAGHNFLSA